MSAYDDVHHEARHDWLNERELLRDEHVEPPEPVVDVAEKIVRGSTFTDEDAVRVARAFLEADT